MCLALGTKLQAELFLHTFSARLLQRDNLFLAISELIERDIYDTTILVQQASVMRQRIEQSINVNEEYHYLHLKDMLKNVINNKEKLASIDGGFVSQPVPVNASLESEYIPISIYHTRTMEESCKQLISFPDDLSDYHRFLNIPTFSDLVLAIESYDFTTVITNLRRNLDSFNMCSSQYSGFLNDVKAWTIHVHPAYDEPGTGFIYEEVAAPMLKQINWYEANVLNPYKKNEVTKLQLRDQLTDYQITDLVTNAETLQNAITSHFCKTMRDLVSAIQAELQTNYTKALRFLANFQSYLPNKQHFYRARAQKMLILRIPTAAFETSEILSFPILENETWKVWPPYMDIQYFVDNQIGIVFKNIDVSLFNVIEDEITSLDGRLHDYVNSINTYLQSLKSNLDSLRARSVVNDEFVL